ncbi:hypothetical protein CYMTET_13261, partial [Cymbomonas tetramitiformis]
GKRATGGALCGVAPVWTGEREGATGGALCGVAPVWTGEREGATGGALCGVAPVWTGERAGATGGALCGVAPVWTGEREGATGDLTLGRRALWEAGLAGSGEVVGLGDSGADLTSCYLYDPYQRYAGMNHRKMAMYRQLVDHVDGNGHGTHCAVSIAGAAAGSGSGWTEAQADNGLAKDARLAVTDLGSGSNNHVEMPMDMEEFYGHAYDVGARVHSDAWGLQESSYTVTCQEVDRYAWEHQDFLPVFAAGNSGYQRHTLAVTLMAPATAKNALTVGASLSTVGVDLVVRNDTFMADFWPQVAAKEAHPMLQATFGGDFMELAGMPYQDVVAAQPPEACTGVWNGEQLRDKIVVVRRGACRFIVKAQHLQHVGARAMLVVNNQEGVLFKMGAGDDPTDHIYMPLGALGNALGSAFFTAGADQMEQVRFTAGIPAPARHDHVADYSSIGPTGDGRLKPDLVAVGDTITSGGLRAGAATTTTHCTRATLSGTSMAASFAAAAAAITRQYFREGFYPTGSRNSAHSMLPSGALVKAALVSGAVSLEGGATEAGLPLGHHPSFEAGFGRLQLDQSLPLPGSGAQLYVEDALSPLGAGEEHSFCLHTSGAAGELKVTLVWHDPPASVLASRALVNDLDLELVTSATAEIHHPNGLDTPDRHNNVEQIVHPLVAGPPEQYRVRVSAHNVPYENQQPYALVVLGRAFTAIGPCVTTLVVDSAPPVVGANSTATFAFSRVRGSGDAVARELLQCQLESRATDTAWSAVSPWHPCVSPHTYAGLAPGHHRFSVAAVSVNGTVGIPATWWFEVDAVPPTVHLIATEAPRGGAMFVFNASETNVSFECSLNTVASTGAAADWEEGLLHVAHTTQPCHSPMDYPALHAATYNFSVVAKDLAGNSGASWWLWESVPAATVILVSPASPISNSTTVTVAFELSTAVGAAAASPAQTWCALLPGEPSQSHPPLDSSAEAWSACKSPMVYGGLADGEYTVVLAVLAATPQTTAGALEMIGGRSWVVDTRPPEVDVGGSLLAQQPASGEVHPNLTMHFSVADFGGSGVERTDPMRAVGALGALHRLSVRAVDRAGNTGESRSLSAAVAATADSAPAVVLTSTLPAGAAEGAPVWSNRAQHVFSFQASGYNHTSGVQFWCQHSHVEWHVCYSPYAYLDAAPGVKIFRVAAEDKLTGMRSYEAGVSWRVDRTPPAVDTPATLQTVLPTGGWVNITFEAAGENAEASDVAEFMCRIRPFVQLPGASTFSWSRCTSPAALQVCTSEGPQAAEVRAREANNFEVALGPSLRRAGVGMAALAYRDQAAVVVPTCGEDTGFGYAVHVARRSTQEMILPDSALWIMEGEPIQVAASSASMPPYTLMLKSLPGAGSEVAAGAGSEVATGRVMLHRPKGGARWAIVEQQDHGQGEYICTEVATPGDFVLATATAAGFTELRASGAPSGSGPAANDSAHNAEEAPLSEIVEMPVGALVGVVFTLVVTSMLASWRTYRWKQKRVIKARASSILQGPMWSIIRSRANSTADSEADCPESLQLQEPDVMRRVSSELERQNRAAPMQVEPMDDDQLHPFTDEDPPHRGSSQFVMESLQLGRTKPCMAEDTYSAPNSSGGANPMTAGQSTVRESISDDVSNTNNAHNGVTDAADDSSENDIMIFPETQDATEDQVGVRAYPLLESIGAGPSRHPRLVEMNVSLTESNVHHNISPHALTSPTVSPTSENAASRMNMPGAFLTPPAELGGMGATITASEDRQSLKVSGWQVELPPSRRLLPPLTVTYI